MDDVSWSELTLFWVLLLFLVGAGLISFMMEFVAVDEADDVEDDDDREEVVVVVVVVDIVGLFAVKFTGLNLLMLSSWSST